MDSEIINPWIEYTESLGLKIRVQDQLNNKSKVYFATSGEMHGKTERNEFLNKLNSLDLIQNKHIPFEYLTSSREDRLELLAGLIDTDGYRVGETFMISQKSNILSENIIFLARSLGYRVTFRKRFVKQKEYNYITIGGNTWDIPTKLPRKQCQPKEKARNWLNYGIEIKPVGIGRFYGFTLKEEPHFVLGDFTVTHNTIAGRVSMAEQLAQMNLLKTPEH
jgi:replicative DNA helicase